MRSNMMEQSYNAIVSDQITDKATGKTREETLQLQQTETFNPVTAKSSSITLPRSSSYTPEFSIYNAYTILQDDFDSDGFCQTFCVVFAADLYSDGSHDLSEVMTTFLEGSP